MRRQVKTFCIVATSSALGALLLDGAPVMAEFRFEPSLSVAETFSDNVDQNPAGQRTEAFITDVSPGATLRWTGARVTSALNLSFTARHQSAGEDKGVAILPDAAGLTTAEAWKEHLFLDASAAASTELLNTRQQDTESNRSNVQTYSASPRLIGSFGNFADAQTFYRFTQVIEDDSGNTGNLGNSGGNEELGNAMTHDVGVSLTSGPDFSWILWTLSGDASESQRDGDDDVSRRAATLDLEYVADRSFSLLGATGYQSFDDGDTENDIDGITWNAGFRWRPGPRTEITATYGRRDKANSLAANLRHEIGPRTTVFASYGEVLETGQERLAQDLSAIGTDPNTGALIDTRTGLPFDPSTSATAIDNDTQRTRTFTAGLDGVRGRNTFNVVGRVEFTKDEGGGIGNEEEDAYALNAGWGRRLSPRAQLGVNASYARNEFARDGRTDNEYAAGLNYSYNIYRNISAVGSYQLAVQTSDSESEEFYENKVTLGIRMSY